MSATSDARLPEVPEPSLLTRKLARKFGAKIGRYGIWIEPYVRRSVTSGGCYLWRVVSLLLKTAEYKLLKFGISDMMSSPIGYWPANRLSSFTADALEYFKVFKSLSVQFTVLVFTS